MRTIDTSGESKGNKNSSSLLFIRPNSFFFYLYSKPVEFAAILIFAM